MALRATTEKVWATVYVGREQLVIFTRKKCQLEIQPEKRTRRAGSRSFTSRVAQRAGLFFQKSHFLSQTLPFYYPNKGCTVRTSINFSFHMGGYEILEKTHIRFRVCSRNLGRPFAILKYSIFPRGIRIFTREIRSSLGMHSVKAREASRNGLTFD